EKAAMEAISSAMEQGQAHPEHEVRHLLKMCTLTHLNDSPIAVAADSAPSAAHPHPPAERLGPHPPERLGPHPPAERLGPHPPAERLGPHPPGGVGPHPSAERLGPHPPAERLGPHPPAERLGPHPPERLDPHPPAERLAPVAPAERLGPIAQQHEAVESPSPAVNSALPAAGPSVGYALTHHTPVEEAPLHHHHHPPHSPSPTPVLGGTGAFRRASARTVARGGGPTQGEAIPRQVGPVGFRRTGNPSASHANPVGSEEGAAPPAQAMFGRRPSAASVGPPEQVVHVEHHRGEEGGVVTTTDIHPHLRNNVHLYRKLEVFGNPTQPEDVDYEKALVWPQVYRYPEAQPPPVIESPRGRGHPPPTPPTQAQSADHSGSERSYAPRASVVRPRPPLPEARRASRQSRDSTSLQSEMMAPESTGASAVQAQAASLSLGEEHVGSVEEGPPETGKSGGGAASVGRRTSEPEASLVTEARKSPDRRRHPKHGPVEGPQGQRVIHMMRHDVEEVTGIGDIWSSDSSLSDDAEAELAKKGFRAQAEAKKVDHGSRDWSKHLLCRAESTVERSTSLSECCRPAKLNGV
ncbi:hypothetical protein FOZ62_027958, partial [Perkinsus olseni]